MADDSPPTYSPDHFPSSADDDPVQLAKKLGKVSLDIIIRYSVCHFVNYISDLFKQDQSQLFDIKQLINIVSLK